ncbi:type II secretion system major pseudopilin GspG [Sphingomonas sp. 36D10-4-7]|uniref:Type II secretion system core protein G n=1 Tax=Sphingomonas corticis TaxID=2722791 RepID=A0ABX1CLP8_9SPHN|nr:type II secretion system major pseudopilin GspG [Sphingomonas corticis]
MGFDCAQPEGRGSVPGKPRFSPAWAPASGGAASRHRKRRREAGFTLVELMVVIVIIGLLATIVALNVLPSGDTARVQKAKADIATIEQGLELYRLQMGSYPTTTQGLNALVTAPAGVDAGRYQAGGYIKRLPEDPWNRAYLYASPGQHGAADVWTLGADGKDGGEGIDADIGSWQ